MEVCLGSPSIFQGSNHRNFINPTNLDTIKTEYQYWDGEHFQNPGKFRYIRLIPKESESIKIAELQFLDKEKVIKGKPLSMKKNNGIDNAFDNDIRTNFNSQKDDWIGMDFSEPVKITSFKVLPRNNFNVIEPGDIYELFVLDTTHISLGQKRATSNFIEYNNIPENSLLYILNRSKGKEFGHFFVNEGTQNWDLRSVRNIKGAQQ